MVPLGVESFTINLWILGIHFDCILGWSKQHGQRVYGSVDLVCILLAVASFKRARYECLNLFACSDGLV